MPEKNFISAGKLGPGMVFRTKDGTHWIVLEQWECATKVLRKDGLAESAWRNRNNNYNAPIAEFGYNGSVADKVCERYQEQMESTGAYKFCVNDAFLVTLDGRMAYGTPNNPLRLMTLVEAQRHMHILDHYRLGKSWWLATSRTVRSAVECYEPTVMCIDDDDSHASINIRKCTESLAVRPCAVFPSDMLVELDEEASRFAML